MLVIDMNIASDARFSVIACSEAELAVTLEVALLDLAVLRVEVELARPLAALDLAGQLVRFSAMYSWTLMFCARASPSMSRWITPSESRSGSTYGSRSYLSRPM